MKNFLFACAVLSMTAQLHAQAMSDPLTKAEHGIYMVIRGNVMKSAEDMSAENYSFKPTADVRTFGELIGHEADGQYEFCSAVVGDGAKSPDVEKTKTSKADLIAALKESFAYCDKAYEGLTDAHAADMVKFFGRQMPKLSVLSLNTAHTDEHYGNIVTYMRMKGLVPPSSKH